MIVYPEECVKAVKLFTAEKVFIDRRALINAPEPAVYSRRVRLVGIPAEQTQMGNIVHKRASFQDPARIFIWSFPVPDLCPGSGIDRLIFRSEPVQPPLPDISGHIQNTVKRFPFRQPPGRRLLTIKTVVIRLIEGFLRIIPV